MIVRNNLTPDTDGAGQLDTGTYPRQIKPYYQDVDIKEDDGKYYIYINDSLYGELKSGGGGGATYTAGAGIVIDSSNAISALYDGETIKVNSSNELFIPIDGTTIQVVNGSLSAPIGLPIEVYNSLSDITNPNNKTLYLVAKSTTTTSNVYDEYIYVNNTFEKIGSTEVDLSNYYTKEETNSLLSGKANASHTHVKADITDFPTIPTVGNAKLTINRNNEKIGEFTANATSDKIVNISVPTVNDSTVYLKDSNNNNIGSFSTNQSNSSTITLPQFDTEQNRYGLVPPDRNLDDTRFLTNGGEWMPPSLNVEYSVYVTGGHLVIPTGSLSAQVDLEQHALKINISVLNLLQ